MILRAPAEWAPHAAMWTAWPSHGDLWAENLEPARAAVAAMILALVQGEPVTVLVANAQAQASARAALARPTPHPIHIRRQHFGDIWLRDTGALVLADTTGRRTAAGFRFNGWGGKYLLDGDDRVAPAMADALGLPFTAHDWVLEGGAIDVDGTGLAVTTEQCLLNPNRNPGLTRADIEARLREDLGITRLLWLGEGLQGDHTDGHVDNLARFVAPGRLAIPLPADAADPNSAVYLDAHARARAFGLDVVPLPSPGLVEAEAEAEAEAKAEAKAKAEIVAASYMNFLIGNAAVIVPTHNRPNDHAAVAAIAALFPGRRTVGVPSAAVLTGGGSFHCITQQVPA
jgi:agmatine deiminase